MAQLETPKELGASQFNIGLISSNVSLPIYVGLDFNVFDDISAGVEAQGQMWGPGGFLAVLGNADYHFNTLLEIPSQFDVYAGLQMGLALWFGGSATYNGFGPHMGIHIGGRYFWKPSMGVQLQLGGGNFYGAKIGITKKF